MLGSTRQTRLIAILCFVAFVALVPLAQSQVVVYRLDFEKTGPSINYGFYDEGYVIAEAAGGPATWVLLFREGPQRFYITIPEFGSLFYAGNPDLIRAVISAAAADGTPQTTFLAIGDLSREVRADNIKVKVAGTLEGSAISADDESEVPFDVTDGVKGYAGTSLMKAIFQDQRTSDANDDGLTVEETLADLLEFLERRGYILFEVDDGEDGDGEDDDGEDGDNGDDPVATPFTDGGGNGKLSDVPAGFATHDQGSISKSPPAMIARQPKRRGVLSSM